MKFIIKSAIPEIIVITNPTPNAVVMPDFSAILGEMYVPNTVALRIKLKFNAFL